MLRPCLPASVYPLMIRMEPGHQPRYLIPLIGMMTGFFTVEETLKPL